VVIELKTRDELDGLRAAGRVVAQTLHALEHEAQVGTRVDELDALARQLLDDAGAVPLLLGEQPRWAPRSFPGAISCSVNDVVAHGQPSRYRLAGGDVVSLACGARLDGSCAEAAVTVVVGSAEDRDAELVRASAQALDDAIAAARPGGRLGDIGHAIGVVGRSAGYGLPGALGGHGIGRQRREAPTVPNEGTAGRGAPLRPGMVLVIAPVFLAGGSDELRTDQDGWTLRTDDGSRAAAVAHTVAITGGGPQVLTRP
jgi:methionyl aminopeptidase